MVKNRDMNTTEILEHMRSGKKYISYEDKTDRYYALSFLLFCIGFLILCVSGSIAVILKLLS